MKALLIPVALCAALAGCATYGDPYGYGYGYGYPAASVTYSTGGYYGAPYGYYRGYPVYRGGRQDFDHDGVPQRYDRDRDNDGVPNRYDRDRDGDGVRNGRDQYPNNPRWR